MENKGYRILSKVIRTFILMTTIAVIGCGTVGAGAAVPAAKPANSSIIDKCKANLAKRLKIDAKIIKVTEKKSVVWPDSSLGMPENGKMYAQMMTPGLRVTLQAGNTAYIYTTSDKSFKYGGPVYSWACSMLYTKSVQNDANLNNDLYQCSLLGTNSVRLLQGVSEYYPQANGVVLAARRTSRSGYDLLYVKADNPGKERILYSAFYVGDAAINNDQTEWAAFIRPSVGSTWMIAIDRIAEDTADAQTISLPDGVMPDRITWTEKGIMVLVKKDDKALAYSISPKDASPEWKEAAAWTFPGTTDYMLNKSESLEISPITVNGKPAVEVAKVWFTGDRNVVAKIENLTLKEHDFLISRFAFILGERDSKSAVFTVDIATGEIIPGPKSIGQDIKPFQYPVRNNPAMTKIK
ncbi:MAG: hypothetical protein ACYC27_05045 [Armatimonadota bacterium]